MRPCRAGANAIATDTASATTTTTAAAAAFAGVDNRVAATAAIGHVVVALVDKTKRSGVIVIVIVVVAVIVFAIVIIVIVAVAVAGRRIDARRADLERSV